MNERILRALNCEPAECTPVWFMRQARRSLPKYRESRADRAMLDILRDPEAAAEITALPLEYFPVDAAVLYNDIATPFIPAGVGLEIRPGVGPVVERPVETEADVARLEPFDARVALDFSLEQIRILRRRLDVPVLGFIGAPFTLCSYLVGGTRRRDAAHLKSWIWGRPEAWRRLGEYWVHHLAEFGIAQREAGAACVQVFDSWAGALSPEEYRAHVLPHSRALIERMSASGVPVIHFATGNPALLSLLAEAGGDVIGVDWRQPLDEAWSVVGRDRGIQGNLDPAALLAGEAVALAKTRDILDRAGGRPGHIFNVGHGLLPETDPAVVRAVVDFVHDYTAKHS